MICWSCGHNTVARGVCAYCQEHLIYLAHRGRLGRPATPFSRLLHLVGWHDYNWAWPGYPVCVICGKVQGSHVAP